MTTAAALDPRIAKAFKGLNRAVGNSPLLAVNFSYRGEHRTIYAKSEQLNMTGSIKDRMALHIIEKAERELGYRPTVVLEEGMRRLVKALAPTHGGLPLV